MVEISNNVVIQMDSKKYLVEATKILFRFNLRILLLYGQQNV